MDKFIIKPSIEFKVSKDNLEKIKSDLDLNSSENKLIKASKKRIKIKGANSFIIVEPDSGDTYSAIPIIDQDSFFVARFPDPIHIFFNQAYKNFNLFKSLFSNIVFKSNPDSKILIIEDSLFNAFLEAKIATIVFLQAALEAFINHIIPEKFSYEKKQKDGSNSILGKDEIIRNLNIKVKIKEILPKVVEIDFNVPEFKNNYDNILEMISVRDALIHLKIKKLSNNLTYNGEIENIVNLKIDRFLESTINIVNFIRKDYLSFVPRNSNYFKVKFSHFTAFKTDISIFLKLLQIKHSQICIEIPFSNEKHFHFMKDWIMQNLEVMRDYNHIEHIDSKKMDDGGLQIFIQKTILKQE